MSKISISVDGQILTGWEEVQVSKSMDHLSGSFSVTQSAITEDGTIRPIPIFPGDKVQVTLAGSPFMTGWVDDIDPKVNGRSHIIGVSGRELTCDLVDCGLTDTTGQWKNVDLKQLANQLSAPFGLKVESAPADLGQPFPKFSAEPGDSVFQTLNKACTLRGVLPMTTGSGNIALIQSGDGRAADRLVYGVNVKAASGKFSNKDRFSLYVVRGQDGFPRTGTASANKTIGVEARAQDPDVVRFRPIVIVAGNTLDQKTAQRRASWEAQTRAAKAGGLEVVVRGWTQSTGELWECARLVSVEIPYLLGEGSQDFLINTVKYAYGAGGTTATLSLARPDAFEPIPETGPSAKKVKAQADPWANIRKSVRGS